RYRLMSSGDLHVLDVSLSDSGVYQCVAHNPFVGEMVKANHKVILEVQNTTNVSSPVLSAFPEPTTSVVLGSNVTLECVAHGFPPPQITWTKKNGHLPYHRNYQDTGNLLLFGVLEQDRGTYTCSANNSAGFVRAETALEVEEVPQIVKGPQNGYVQEGGDVKLDCEARGSLPLSFTWIHNGRVVSEIRHTTSNESSLVLSNIVRKQAGIYQCFASNKLDTTYAVSEVKVLPKEGASSSSETSNAKEIKLEKFIPDHRGNGERNETKKNDAKQSTGVAVKLVPPSKPDVTQLSEKSVLVRWKVPKNSGLSILFFKVQYKPAGNPWITVDNEIGPNVWSYTVSKLKTG
ncbi:interference hedgehog-like, partial [Limulus polyphemus]|uniref:Interference hedgehog-like n=1 Tax=Limulus polyphemus TaxID=6850 RepID=A0ABM1RXT7_LIMPO